MKKLNKSTIMFSVLALVIGVCSSLLVFSQDSKENGNGMTGMSSDYSCESADTDTGVKTVDSKNAHDSSGKDNTGAKSVGGSSPSTDK